MSNRKLMAMCVGLSVLTVSHLSGGQERGASSAKRVPVWVVLSAPSSQEASFVIKRNPSGTVGDYIILSDLASAIDLSKAVQALLQVRRLDGDSAVIPRTLRLRSTQASGRTFPRIPWAARVLTDLRSAEPSAVPPIGFGRAIRIWLPKQNLKRPIA